MKEAAHSIVSKGILVLAFLCLPGFAQAPVQSVSVADATYALLSRDIGTTGWNFTCTSFAVEWRNNRTYLLTARHCIFPHRQYVLVPDKNAPWASIVTVDHLYIDADIARISVSDKLVLIPLGIDPKAGEHVSATGWPEGMGKFYYEGVVAAMPDGSTGSMLVVYMPGLGRGMSGSALFCKDQKAVCGIIVGTYIAAPVFVAAEPISRASEPSAPIH